MYLLKQLWQNYQLPQNDAELEPTLNTWMRFFSTVTEQEVTQAIVEISAEGCEFAPQIGQIYSRVKRKREALKATENNYDFDYDLYALYAELKGVEPPPISDGPDRWHEWFQSVKRKDNDISICD